MAWTVGGSNQNVKEKLTLDYIKNRVYPGDIMNSMLVFMTDQKAGGKDAAYEFLAKHGKVWESWVSSDVAKKVKSAL